MTHRPTPSPLARPKRVLRLDAPRSSSAVLTLDSVEVIFSMGRPVAFAVASSPVVLDRSWWQRPYTQRHILRWRSDAPEGELLPTLDFTARLTEALSTDLTKLLERFQNV